jgi:hypothetical protein
MASKRARSAAHQAFDGDNGRIKTRTCTVFHNVGWLQGRHQRRGHKALVMVDSTREVAEKIEGENPVTSQTWLSYQMEPVIRGHWVH